ncbi:MAG: tRNA nucleotidyltransferase/poly(A) polymerase family protein, partial [Candidatus Geothermincolia bacterium]
KVMFPEHDKVGAELTRAAMRRLRYSTEEIQATVFLVRRHMRPIHYERGWSDAAVRRLVRDCTLSRNGDVIVPLSCVIELARADVKAGNLDRVPHFLGIVDDLESRIAGLEAPEEIHRAASPLDGRELMDLFGRDPGPWLKAVKNHLEHLVIEGELARDDKEGAARRARVFLNGTGKG